MKKWAKFLCCFALLGAFLVGGLAGCGTVSNIKNKSNELIYNGNAATLVEANEGDFLYFANAFATAPTNGSEYSAAKKYSYLARVNSKLDSKNAYFSPKNVENFSSEVAGYDDSFMFVLGQNIYYATPNRQKVVTETDGKKDEAYHFEYTCIYKSSLNGDHKKKLLTTTSEISKIEVLKSEDKYYLVVLAGEKLVAINLSNDKVQTLATGVKSVALPKTYQKDVAGSTEEWNGQIYFTTSPENTSGSGASTVVVNKIAVNATNEDEAEELYFQGSVTFVARERDVVFFLDTLPNGQPKIYMIDLKDQNEKSAFLANSPRRKIAYEGTSVSATTISDLHAVTNTKYYNGNKQINVLGYVFKADSAWRFLSTDGKDGTITFSEDLSSAKALFVEGGRIYFSTTTGLYRADLTKLFLGSSTEVQAEKFVTMTDISGSGLFAYYDDNLYFYAKLQEIPEDLKDEDEEEDEENAETDDNFYLYRANVNRTDDFELLGQTTIESRRTK